MQVRFIASLVLISTLVGIAGCSSPRSVVSSNLSTQPARNKFQQAGQPTYNVAIVPSAGRPRKKFKSSPDLWYDPSCQNGVFPPSNYTVVQGGSVTLQMPSWVYIPWPSNGYLEYNMPVGMTVAFTAGPVETYSISSTIQPGVYCVYQELYNPPGQSANGGAYWFQFTVLPAIEIKDAGGNVVSGTTPTAHVVGRQLALSVVPTDGNATLSSIQWGLTGNPIDHYNFAAGYGPSNTNSSSLNAAAVSFYWADLTPSETASVVATASENGVSGLVSSAAPYNIIGPSNISMTVQESSVQDSFWNLCCIAMSLGTTLNLPSSAGIQFNFSATAPPGSDGNGYFAASQQVSENDSQVATPNFTPTPPPLDNNGTNVYWRDGCALMTTQSDGSDGHARNLYVAGAQPVTYITVDAPEPAFLSDALNQFTANEAFKTWFMYRPTGVNSIWVPLGEVRWHWQATANRTGPGVWASPSSEVTPAPIVDQPATHFPSWPDKFLGPTCAPVPNS